MRYKILQVHAKYENGELVQLATQWYSNEEMGWVRASYCENKPVGGYGSLKRHESISPELLQYVTGYGMNLPDNLKKKYFPGKHNWER